MSKQAIKPQPPREPELHASLDYSQAETLLNQLWELTHAIVPLSTGENLPALNQLIIRRGNLIEQCRRIHIKAFETAQQEKLQALFGHCKAMDVEIERNMRDFREHIDEQLKHLQQSRKLLGKYQTCDIEAQKSQFRDA